VRDYTRFFIDYIHFLECVQYAACHLCAERKKGGAPPFLDCGGDTFFINYTCPRMRTVYITSPVRREERDRGTLDSSAGREQQGWQRRAGLHKVLY